MNDLAGLFDEFYGRNIVFHENATEEQKAKYREKIKAYFAAGASAAIHLANQRMVKSITTIGEGKPFEVLEAIENEASTIYYGYVGIDHEVISND